MFQTFEFVTTRAGDASRRNVAGGCMCAATACRIYRLQKRRHKCDSETTTLHNIVSPNEGRFARCQYDNNLCVSMKQHDAAP
eukprot:6205812-Pleurochrysis_carterae.AAC.3